MALETTRRRQRRISYTAIGVRILTVLRLAGAALHPLALGNVATFRRLLDQSDDTKNILIIGIGGVQDADGAKRMQAVGAGAVGLASSLGRHGIKIFEVISGKDT